MQIIRMGKVLQPYAEKECPSCHAIIAVNAFDFNSMRKRGETEVYCPVCKALMGDINGEFKKWWEDGLDWYDLRNKGLKEE